MYKIGGGGNKQKSNKGLRDNKQIKTLSFKRYCFVLLQLEFAKTLFVIKDKPYT
jgi:hypothetical protein